MIVPYDRDGKTRGGEANVTVLIGDGTGRFTALKGSPFSLGACTQPTQVAAADLKAGPLLHIAVTWANSARLALLTPDGRGYRLSFRPMRGSTYGLAAADFFGTGKMHLAVSNHANGSVTLLRVR